MTTAQLVLALEHRPALGIEDFLVASCNAEAVASIDRWPAWPAPALVLHGPPGSGKTHLAHVWRGRSDAVAFDPARPDHGAAHGAVLVDDADRLADEEALLHLYNLVASGGGSLLITAATPPARWPLRLADLRSRLVAAPTVAILPPDDALLGAVLAKQFRDRQLSVADDVIGYVVPRMERSFAAARALAAALDRAALARRRSITVPLARSVLEAGERSSGAPEV